MKIEKFSARNKRSRSSTRIHWIDHNLHWFNVAKAFSLLFDAIRLWAESCWVSCGSPFSMYEVQVSRGAVTLTSTSLIALIRKNSNQIKIFIHSIAIITGVAAKVRMVIYSNRLLGDRLFSSSLWKLRFFFSPFSASSESFAKKTTLNERMIQQSSGWRFLLLLRVSLGTLFFCRLSDVKKFFSYFLMHQRIPPERVICIFIRP